MIDIRPSLIPEDTIGSSSRCDAGPSTPSKRRVPRSESLPQDKIEKVRVIERDSRGRKNKMTDQLKEAIDDLDPGLLKQIMELIPPSPSKRQELTLSEIYGIAAVVVRYV